MAHGEKPLIGILMSIAESDREASSRREAILEGLGRTNLRIITRFGRKNSDDSLASYDDLAKDLVRRKPVALFSSCLPTMRALRTATVEDQAEESKRIPIVYAGLFSKTGQTSHYDFGGNVTGFVSHEFDVCKRWPGYLSKIARRVRKAAVIRENTQGGISQYRAIQEVAGDSVELIDLTTAASLEPAIKAFKDRLGDEGGLIVTTGALTATLAEKIIELADKYKLPAIYPNRLYSIRGGLVSYGADLLDLYRGAGRWLGKILDGAHPSDFRPYINRHFELAINLNTAESLGLTPVLDELLDEASLLIGGR